MYVTPAEGMMIRAGQHVDPQGKVYHPFLSNVRFLTPELRKVIVSDFQPKQKREQNLPLLNVYIALLVRVHVGNSLTEHHRYDHQYFLKWAFATIIYPRPGQRRGV